jgi:hypothetical protein
MLMASVLIKLPRLIQLYGLHPGPSWFPLPDPLISVLFADATMAVVYPWTCYLHRSTCTGTRVLCLCTGGGYWLYNFDHYTRTRAHDIWLVQNYNRHDRNASVFDRACRGTRRERERGLVKLVKCTVQVYPADD